MTKSARQALIDNAMAERVQCRAWPCQSKCTGWRWGRATA